MNLFDLSLKLNHFPIEEARRRLNEIQSNNASAHQKYIEESRESILNFHYNQNPFYQGFIRGPKPTRWSDVPVMQKRDLQKPLIQRLSNDYRLNKVYVNSTSGSSGDPFTFAKDRFCHAMTWAVIKDRFSWYGLDFNSSLQARFYGIPLDKKDHLKERLKDAISKRYRFTVFDLSDEAFHSCVDKFKSTPFKYINGYTSPIVQFAKYLDRNNLNLKSICPTLECCIVTSEMLFADDKKLMETVFGLPVINEYGASELDLIAFENPSGQWQINTETLYVEILDGTDQILPNGREGRIVITSLFNKAHPFIRYDIGDVGIISEKSSPKKPILKKLIGRTNDIALLPSGKKAAGLTFYYVTKKIIEDNGNVKEFIVEQLTKDCFKIIYVGLEEITPEKRAFIEKEMMNYLEDGLKIIFERRNIIKRMPSGKLKQFVSKL